MPSAQISDLLKKFREASSNTTQQGKYFEKFCREWLTLSGQYPEIESVVMWNEWPNRAGIADIGIDLVAKTVDDKYYAIQCKFYLEDSKISKEDIDSFLAAAGKEYRGVSFCQLIVMTTADLGANARKTIDGHNPPCNVVRVDQFDDSSFDWDKALRGFVGETWNGLADATRAKKTPRPHQELAIEHVVKGFASGCDRGKLIMACGTGKTFTALRIAEEETLVPQNGLVLYLVPSLMLLAQTLKEWSRESRRLITPILVCSDSQAHERDVRAKDAFAPKKSKKKSAKAETDDDEPTVDACELTRPATTNPETVARRWREIEDSQKSNPKTNRLTVVFSTYQSLEVVSKAQHDGVVIDGEKVILPTFDLVICDEAHRTTGVSLAGKDESMFARVHDDAFLRADKRLYMTATPRVYSDSANLKAIEKNATLCSMDDEALYGPEFYRLGFGDAVSQNLLSDYKVVILSVSEKEAEKYFNRYTETSEIARNESLGEEVNKEDIDVDDVAKMIGCWRALAKNRTGMTNRSDDFNVDPLPMKRAVAFNRSIKESKEFVKAFKIVADALVEEAKNERTQRSIDRLNAEAARSDDETERARDESDAASCQEGTLAEPLNVELRHVDGGFSGNERERELQWLRDEEPGTCRILSNVRCLSEGVDVPTLDAALFIAPRNSQVDVIQAVGRVMRKAPGKKFGYVVLPIVVSDDVDQQMALDSNERYRVVWQTLNALRSHDERFRIMINQLQVGEKSDTIIAEPPKPEPTEPEVEPKDPTKPDARQTSFFEQDRFQQSLRAAIVKRCGDRNYLDQWAKEVAEQTTARIGFIREKLANPTEEQKAAFGELVDAMKEEVSPKVNEDDALDFLTQHLTTLPVFDALFGGNAFSRNNPVAQRLERVVRAFNQAIVDPDEIQREELLKADVRRQIEGITTAEGRRAVIHKLYEQFFNVALPKTAEKLGVVYTPNEVVDYILLSVDQVMRDEFGSSLSNEEAHVLDPFTGTGSFISRLISSGIIDKKDLKRKYEKELHANEIMLLAYYIAAANIEETFRSVAAENGVELDSSTAFPGIVLTDTFQLGETPPPEEEEGTLVYEEKTNSRRRRRQKRTPIKVIVGNPPYSVGQRSGNDFNQNEYYENLAKRVAQTYVAQTSASNKNSLYDSYIKAFRWASDRIGEQGVIGFVSNGSYIDNAAMDGFRKSVAEEFSTIYVFNLRGNARTSGELRRKEKDNVFGQGTRTTIAITILVKNPKAKEHKIFYHDIGDYLTREEKLAKIKSCAGVKGTEWSPIVPNERADWINQRGDKFSTFFALGGKKDKEGKSVTFFEPVYGSGLQTGRDAWAYNYSRTELIANMTQTINFYNSQVRQLATPGGGNFDYNNEKAEPSQDTHQISWTRELLNHLKKGKLFDGKIENFIRYGLYRPFCIENAFFHKMFNKCQFQLQKQFPSSNTSNLMICTTGAGTNAFSVLISEHIPDTGMLSASQCFPLYYYEPLKTDDFLDYPGETVVDGYVQRYAITDEILAECEKRYGTNKDINKEDIFFYVYGALHSPKYREDYENDLRKELARLPLPKKYPTFMKYSELGRELADLHVNYETGVSTIPTRDGKPHELPEPQVLKTHIVNADGLDDAELYRVDSKMKLGKKKANEIGEDDVRYDGVLRYNDHISFSGIPAEAFKYLVNGRSPIEWLVERYYRRVDKASGLVDDPNLWSDDPKYIFNLVPRLVALSLRTLELTDKLPDLEE